MCFYFPTLLIVLQMVPPEHPRDRGGGAAEGARLRGQLPGEALQGEPGGLHPLRQAQERQRHPHQDTGKEIRVAQKDYYTNSVLIY